MAYAAYEYYKPSGITTIGLIPHHWTVRRLKFMARIQNGKDYKEVVSEDGFPVIGSGGEFAKASAYLYNGESVLLGRKGTIDRPLYINGPFWTVDTMFYTEVAADVSAKYLYYCALTINFLKYATSTALPSMTQQDLGAIPFALPKHDEQQAIARFLDFKTAQIDALIAKKKALLDKLAEKRTALISHAVTKGLDSSVAMKDSGVAWLGDIPEHWTVSKLAYLSESLQTGPFGSQLHAEEYIEGGVPLINPTDISNGEVLENAKITVGEDVVERLSRHKLELGDIVIARRGEMGRAGLVRERNVGWLCGTGSLRARLNKQALNPEFLLYQFSMRGVAEYLSLQSVGSTMDNLNTSILGRLPVIVPPLHEQAALVLHLRKLSESIDSQAAKVGEVISSLQEYRSALITNAVTGKIDVRGFAIPQLAEGVAS